MSEEEEEEVFEDEHYDDEEDVSDEEAAFPSAGLKIYCTSILHCNFPLILV